MTLTEDTEKISKPLLKKNNINDIAAINIKMQIYYSLFTIVVVTTLISAQKLISGSAKSTIYSDMCKPSCSWIDKADFNSYLKSVTKSGQKADQNAPSGCVSYDPNAAFADPKQQPFAINNSLAYGYAAAGRLNGASERDLCCSCLELTFTSTAIQGKKMIVQITNTGSDLNGNHIDLQIPGGGWGIFEMGQQQLYGNKYFFGRRYGGVSTREQCSGLPSELQSGCQFRFDWFEGADNPNVAFKTVVCPARITEISGCVRKDAVTLPSQSPPKPLPANDSCPVATYEQCGGLGYTGQKCCDPDQVCYKINNHYSMCILKSDKRNLPCTNKKYQQCDGKDFKGNKCCPTKTKCKKINNYYSQCL